MHPDLVEARRALLDFLDAVKAHVDRGAVILIGAQAVYLRVGDAGLAIEPYTLDGDVALVTALLDPGEPLAVTLDNRSFRSPELGRWRAPNRYVIDVLVPEAFGGPGRRAARLPAPHGKETARKAIGLEAALVDNDPLVIPALDPGDPRSWRLPTAGPGALLAAKCHKITERSVEGGDRTRAKDSLDVLRLLRGTTTEELASRMRLLLGEDTSSAITEQALGHLRALYADDHAPGARLAAEAVGRFEDPEEIAASCVALSRDLCDALGMPW